MNSEEAKRIIANVVNGHQRAGEGNYCDGCYAGYYQSDFGTDKFNIGEHVADMIEKEFQ